MGLGSQHSRLAALSSTSRCLSISSGDLVLQRENEAYLLLMEIPSLCLMLELCLLGKYGFR